MMKAAWLCSFFILSDPIEQPSPLLHNFWCSPNPSGDQMQFIYLVKISWMDMTSTRASTRETKE